MLSPHRAVARAGGLVCAMLLGVTLQANAGSIKVVTFNTHHGGLATTPPSTDLELDMLAAQNPDAIVLQEAYSSQLDYFVNGLNTRFGTTAWHGAYIKHCVKGTAPTCTTYNGEAVIILTRLTTLSTNSTLLWTKDSYFAARGAIHMRLRLADGTTVNVFGCHLPSMGYQQARVNYVNGFKTWSAAFGSPRVAGGDFNDSPGTAPIVAMTQGFDDAWALLGSGSGLTHAHGSTLATRIDYWFGESNSLAVLTSVKVCGNLAFSDHLAVIATYTVATAAVTGETTVMDDGFATPVAANWPSGLFTGTQDTAIPLAINGGFQIGALKEGVTGSHYGGIGSAKYDLSSNGSAYVRLLQAPNTATTAYAMFAAGSDGSNFYRWYESANALVVEKKIAGTKRTLLNLPYDPSLHQYLRIRREFNAATGTNEVVFETAADNAGAPGAFTVRYREAWDARVVANGIRFELKAGTSECVIAPGVVVWDTFHAAVNSR